MDEQRAGLQTLMGPSEAVSRLVTRVNQVAQSDFTVVIIGETGSGKELVARAIHEASQRWEGPFVAVDCGAIPETLLESELFGHERGAFTGAVNRRQGKFEAALDGTLFLDEISNLTLGAQAALLRALQEKVISRVGGTRAFDVDVRIVVATNQGLGGPQPEQGGRTFRRDLLFRLNEFTVRVPPLRERPEDIPFLAGRFLRLTNTELRKSVAGFSDPAMAALEAYHWPGNVRQLRSVVRQAVLLAAGQVEEEHLNLADQVALDGAEPAAPAAPTDPGANSTLSVSLPERPWDEGGLRDIVRQAITEVEREVIARTLRHTGGNKSKAARLLRVDYKTMHTKAKTLGL